MSPNPRGPARFSLRPPPDAGAVGPGRRGIHLFQELGCALRVASPYLLPEHLEPWRVVAVTVFASLALHVVYG